MSNLANPGNFLRTSRNFPKEPHMLSVELSKAYIDIANEVNNRISGIFGTGSQTITSESWFVNGQSGRQNTLRQAYTFTSAGSINHGINFGTVSYVTRIFGSFTDGTNWYPLPYTDATAANNQVQVVITPTQIQITSGAGSPPTISKGIIVLEWISQV